MQPITSARKYCFLLQMKFNYEPTTPDYNYHRGGIFFLLDCQYDCTPVFVAMVFETQQEYLKGINLIYSCLWKW